MNPEKSSIVPLSQKIKTITGKSEYTFHFTSQPVQEDICYFEGYYKEAGLKAGLHIHKTITEIFTITEGEFTFQLPDKAILLRPGDTFIAAPFQPHGFSSNLPHSRMQILSIGFKNREKFFIELEKIATGKIKPEEHELEAFFNRFDQYTVQG